MNIIELVFVFFAPIVILSWTLQFKKYFSLLSIAPVLFMVLAVFALNSDPTVSFNVTDLACPSNVTFNATNASDYCAHITDEVPYTIQPRVMTLINLTTMIAMFMVLFVVFRRVTNIFTKGKQSEEE